MTTQTLVAESTGDLAAEVARRRTFAIISHPDAGKTTLTEKFLLYSGAIDLAGAIRARKNQRRTVSDWMAIEQERGISISSTAIQFEYQGCRFNLLDTPGHQDFSEDTFRTLVAVDSAVMVIDRANGIEAQTRRLFEVCSLRKIPILTFINKMDRDGKDAFELLDEIERVLGISAVPLNWPIGGGADFQGVYDLVNQRVFLYSRASQGGRQAVVSVHGINDPELERMLGREPVAKLREDVELLAGVGAAFDHARLLRGEQTALFFGSALHNFGIEPFLEAMLTLAPPPGPRQSDRGLIPPTGEELTGFVFKIQANMDPQHRDSMAFLRICSGRFQKDMSVFHSRLGRRIRLTRPHRLFARERETVEEAYPGDVVGLINPGVFAIGDTVSLEKPLRFTGFPRFSPEFFATIESRDSFRSKQFHKGLRQLEEEGAIQVLIAKDAIRREPILAAVGELQFDVVRARLETEYNTPTTLERLSYQCARWLHGDPAEIAELARSRRGVLLTTDTGGQTVGLFASDWELDRQQREHPKIEFRSSESAD